MSTHRRRLDRHTAEQMLDGAPAADGHPLNDLLAVVAAPARDSELAGEHAAVTAFRAARLGTAHQPRRPSMLETSLAKLFTARIAAIVAVLVVAAGGVATAAATGYLPGPLGANSTVAPASSSSPTASTALTPAGRTTGNGDSGDHGAAPQPGSASPSPSLAGLCNAYTADAGSEPGKALDSPAFDALITTAGGKDKVDAYCADLLAGQRGKSDDTTKAAPPASKEADHTGPGHGPNSPPSTHPDPEPAHPTGSPVTHPGH